MTKPAAEKVVDFDERRTAEQAATELMPVLSEDKIAIEFVERNRDFVRYDDKKQCWYVWTGCRWQRDESDIAFSWARSLTRAMAADQNLIDRRRLGALKFARGVEAFARTDQRIKQTMWDFNVEALGTPNGIVDLRTGKFFAPDPEQYITRSVAVDPADIIDCRRWLQFLNEVTAGDAGFKTLLKQWAGYCLTAETIEQKLVFIHGVGGTGKTVFANTLRRIMGEYATTADMSTFADKHGYEQHAQQFARLDGMRLVVSSETEAGHTWRENRVKQLTGGDPLVANFMRQNSFEFTPRFKLLFLGNHAPRIVNLDDAIKRRFLLVPFLHRPETPNPHLEEILMSEYPGILRWAIDGAVEWYTRGNLDIPATVQNATAQYFANEDTVGTWLAECCDIELGNHLMFGKSVDLYASWSTFAQSRGEAVGTQKDFNERLRNRGFVSEQIKVLNTTGFRGIRLQQKKHWQDDQ
jgi:putative DNA primase/helicase